MVVCVIPARAGSKRFPDKNIAPFFGVPLLVRAIRAARVSGVVDEVIVTSDSPEYLALAAAERVTVVVRPPELASGDKPYDAIAHALLQTNRVGVGITTVIIRATNPLRIGATIARALRAFEARKEANFHLRAVAPADVSPFKFWIVRSGHAAPLITSSLFLGETQCQNKDIYYQNGCVEIYPPGALLSKLGALIGIVPFITEGYEGLDVNTPDDLEYAEWLVRSGRASLPEGMP